MSPNIPRLDDAPPLAIGAVLLAAGAGSRLGGRPKSLLEYAGESLLKRALRALAAAGASPIVVVTGHYADAIAGEVGDFPAALIRNPAPDEGQPSSVQLGIDALPAALDAIIVALADQPLIERGEIDALVRAFRQRGDASLVAPRVSHGGVPGEHPDRGQPGNPIMIDARLRAEWSHGAKGAYSRIWREQNPDRVHWFDTHNRHYRLDIDTPGDMARFAELTGHTLRWPDSAA